MTEYIIECDYDFDEGWIPDEQREEIVRCCDCKHGHEVTWPVQSEIPSNYLDCSGYLVETWDYYNDDFKDNPVPPDGFCAWGERREPWLTTSLKSFDEYMQGGEQC